MRRKIPMTYVYNSKDNTFKEYRDLTYDRVDFSHQFDGIKYHVYGVDYANNFRIEIAKHSGDVFHNKDKHEYSLYLNKPDKSEAVKLISDYVLNRIEIDISYLEKQLDFAKEKRNKCKEFKNREAK